MLSFFFLSIVQYYGELLSFADVFSFSFSQRKKSIRRLLNLCNLFEPHSSAYACIHHHLCVCICRRSACQLWQLQLTKPPRCHRSSPIKRRVARLLTQQLRTAVFTFRAFAATHCMTDLPHFSPAIPSSFFAFFSPHIWPLFINSVAVMPCTHRTPPRAIAEKKWNNSRAEDCTKLYCTQL